MPALDANALICDPDGMAFLRSALGEPGPTPRLADRFGDRARIEPRVDYHAGSVELPVAPAPDCVEPRFAEAFA